ncbi:MAG: bifunctional enoyl-CoA hydratase/phosphate acetyltransferase [Bacteroidales bacterium]|nr:bifunctional enoyl-CoA hydratase/phosphate acetyltransferase [Bacteroidales bacterium]MBQ7490054.1 bifunctional enoyl-CoA hydratase/phosphate acetyltransferase [Bacteroidales bacterium]
MSNITKLDQIIELVKTKPRKRLVAAYANDEHTIEAVNNAVEMGIVDATLVGEEAVIREVCGKLNINADKFRIINEPVDVKAAAKAIDLINAGEGDILMKGLLSTDKYMRAILNKEKGLMPGPKAVLSHVTVIETPRYHKLIICGDVAIIPAPDLQQKVAITNYLIKTAKALQIEKPKVALLAATEQVLPAMQACVDACLISKMAERGQIKGALVDGPLGLDLAIDAESVRIKGLKSEVAGDADCLLFPNIESGNLFYKSNTKLAGAELGAMVIGAKVPCVLTSRGDSSKSKLYSISLAASL